MIKLKKNITIINKILKKNIIQQEDNIHHHFFQWFLEVPYSEAIILYDTFEN